MGMVRCGALATHLDCAEGSSPSISTTARVAKQENAAVIRTAILAGICGFESRRGHH